MHIFCSMLSNWACQSVNTYLLGVYVAHQTNPFPELLLLCFQGPVIHTGFLIAIFFFKVDSPTFELQEGRWDCRRKRILLSWTTSPYLRVDNLPYGHFSVNSAPFLFCLLFVVNMIRKETCALSKIQAVR